VSAVVSDSSPLNYLALLSDFDLLRQIYGTLVIPPEVHREVVERGAAFPVGKAVTAALGNWITVAGVPNSAQVVSLRRDYRLDLGESQAILVAENLGGVPLLMDERRGVRCARARGITVIRTPMIYADAKILGLIQSIRTKLDDLRLQGFRLSDRHYELILRELGEL
jgi:predicted nucleic acid-binding protein